MSDLKHLTQEALQLPVAERVTLAESLLLTVSGAEDALVDPQVLDEAERRLAELRNGAVPAVPAAVALARARAALR